MATADEILSMMAEDEEAVLIVDNDLRTIAIPDGVKILGVESDDDVQRLRFRMPRMRGEFDLSGFVLRINIKNAAGEPDEYTVSDEKISDDMIEFSWLVGRFAAKRSGSVEFSICAKKMSGEEVDKEFNTMPASLPVLKGLEGGKAVVQNNPDIVESILLRLGNLESSGGGGAGGARIDDNATSASSTWSSEKISAEIDKISLTPGPAGPAGYTPVRGVDYWTEEDKQSIVSGVLSALPNASGVSF